MNKNIIDQVKGRITDAAHIDLVKTPINFICDDGKMIMEGVVDGISAKRKAVIAASSVCPGIVDRLKIRPASHMGDRDITRRLRNVLDEDFSLEAENINISVTQEAEVYLEGTVHSLTHKKLAEVLAWWIPGSVNVVNNLNVTPYEKDSDEEITEAVKQVFERDKLVMSGNVLVKVKDATVTLAGIVKSAAAKDAAEDDVWCIFGVKDVINKLEVRST